MAVEYDNAVDDIQTTIRSILVNDTAEIVFLSAGESVTNAGATLNNSCKILDGTPEKLLKGQVFPYIIIRPATFKESRLTNTKRVMILTTSIELYTRREQHIRVLMDAVRDALKRAQATTRAGNYFWYEIPRTDMTIQQLPNGEVVYLATLDVDYKAVCS